MTIIKNYGIPDNCYMCDLHNYHECNLTGESIEEDYCWNGDSREKHCPLREVEAIPKNQYMTDMVAMLEELYMEIEELDTPSDDSYDACIVDCEKLIQEKINSLKAESEDT